MVYIHSEEICLSRLWIKALLINISTFSVVDSKLNKDNPLPQGRSPLVLYWHFFKKKIAKFHTKFTCIAHDDGIADKQFFFLGAANDRLALHARTHNYAPRYSSKEHRAWKDSPLTPQFRVFLYFILTNNCMHKTPLFIFRRNNNIGALCWCANRVRRLSLSLSFSYVWWWRFSPFNFG